MNRNNLKELIYFIITVGIMAFFMNLDGFFHGDSFLFFLCFGCLAFLYSLDPLFYFAMAFGKDRAKPIFALLLVIEIVILGCCVLFSKETILIVLWIIGYIICGIFIMIFTEKIAMNLGNEEELLDYVRGNARDTVFFKCIKCSKVQNKNNKFCVFCGMTLNKKTTETVKNEKIILKCAKCGSEQSAIDKFCTSCGMPFNDHSIQVIQDNQFVTVERDYIQGEKIVLKNLILEEFKNQNINEKDFTTNSINRKKNILLCVSTAIILISFILYGCNNLSLSLWLFIVIMSIIICCLVGKKLTVINNLMVLATNYPDVDISVIVSNVKNERYIPKMSSKSKYAAALGIGILLPTLFFFSPRVFYKSYENGYYVLKYTRGIIINKDEVIIPSTHRGKPVVGIDKGAFQNSNVKEVNLPVGLEVIKADAFYGCKNLEYIDIPYTVTAIRGNAFQNAINLTTVNLHEGLIEIRGSAFKNNTSLVNIELPDTLEYLGGGAFKNCSSLVTITIPPKVTEINGETFKHCTSLKQINLHDNIVSIHGETFVGATSLDNVILPPKITEIRGNTFENCKSLTSIIIPEGVTRIGGEAFSGCGRLSYVYVPSTVTEIGGYAFAYCTSLESIKIPYGAEVESNSFSVTSTIVERY